MSEGRDAVLRESRAALNEGSKSFAAAARLLDRETREGATLVYAWCRYCDDVIDGQRLGRGGGPAADPAARLAELALATRRALDGRAVTDPAFAALQRVVRRHRIPHRYPMELLEGFAMDVENRRYATLDDVVLYCYHVAGVVGLMMAHIMGVDDEATLDRACDLGIALQLTNISRDVIDDARLGRVYLPLQWLERESIAPTDIALPTHRAAVARTVARLLDVADGYYRSGDAGIRELPFRSAWSIAVARDVYSAIGAEVRARGAAAWDERVVVSRGRKLRAVLAALWRQGIGRLPFRARPAEAARAGLWTRPRASAGMTRADAVTRE